MNRQFESSPSQEKISSLYQKIKKDPKELVLQPFFQRRLVWSNLHKEKFIQTLLKGYPIPEIYVSQSGVDVVTIHSEDFVVDGQQRLSTIVEYMDEEEGSFATDKGLSIKRYSELTEDEKRIFLSYKIIVRDLGDVSSKDLKEIFERINSTNYGLNAMEIKNALYDGEFISLAKDFILNTKFTEKLDFLSESAITRMEDINYVLLIMSTILEKGYYTGEKEIATYVESFNDVFPEKEIIKNGMIRVFEFINKMELPVDSIWFRKSNYFTLFCELYWKLEEEPELEKNYEIIKISLKDFGKNVIENKIDGNSEFGKYYQAMYSGTNNRTSRVLRGTMVSNVLQHKYKL